MNKTMERLKRTIMVIKADLSNAQSKGTHLSDAVVLETSRKIGIAIELVGKGIQQAASEGKFLDVEYFMVHGRSILEVLTRMLGATIGRELTELRQAEPKDFT